MLAEILKIFMENHCSKYCSHYPFMTGKWNYAEFENEGQFNLIPEVKQISYYNSKLFE